MVGFAKHFDQLGHVASVLVGHEGQRGARFVSAASSADTVDVVLDLVGKVDVDDKLDVVDV